MLNTLNNILFGSFIKIKRFKRNFPHEKILMNAATKAILSPQENNLERSAKWITSRRGILILSEKRLLCGDWEIELQDIVEAELIEIRSLFMKGLVLKIKDNQDRHFQFGLNYDKKWLETDSQDLLGVNLKKGKMGYSPFSIIIRLIAFLSLFYIIFSLTRSL